MENTRNTKTGVQRYETPIDYLLRKCKMEMEEQIPLSENSQEESQEGRTYCS